MPSYSYRNRNRTPARRLVLITTLAVLAGVAVYLNFFTERGACSLTDQTCADPIVHVNPADAPSPDATIDSTTGSTTDAVQAAGPVPDQSDQPTPIVSENDDQQASLSHAIRSDLPSAQAQALLEAGAADLANRHYIAARQKLSQALTVGLPASYDDHARTMLSQAADAWLFSADVFPGDQLCTRYRVASGDRLARIAERSAVPYEFLMRINNIDKPENLRAGSTIKIVQGPFTAVVERSLFRISVYLGNLLVRTYPVGLGAPGQQTPTGLWRVTLKQPNPQWTDRKTHKTYLPNDPENPLGEHWIALDGLKGNAKGRTGFGIHGTIKPDEIGQATSRGCIRLRNEQVAEIYDMLTPGKSTVVVLD